MILKTKEILNYKNIWEKYQKYKNSNQLLQLKNEIL